MKTTIVYLLFMLFSLNVIGQENIEEQNNVLIPQQKLSSSGINYPQGVNGEVFKSFKVNYQFSEKMQLQLQHFYEKYGTHEQTISSFMLKWYIKNNLYLFSGPEATFDINQETGEFESMGGNLFGGVGYEVNPNLLLELGYRARTFNNTKESFGNISPNSFILRASF
ncbi:hypothetical protein JQC67_01050 [Aurantibacter crassamenti]|uniref:hypothetical protein n=1 Tax=Aurantibacter crassamenti TaxID=1837375 RepID=UPI00193A48F3|nr:hypothetical protein [Aurantibacter crassamenti]MBM1104711.1 hypothetical protein [Aurantibacter crassamenti]